MLTLLLFAVSVNLFVACIEELLYRPYFLVVVAVFVVIAQTGILFWFGRLDCFDITPPCYVCVLQVISIFCGLIFMVLTTAQICPVQSYYRSL